jgi:hypothetical protein
MGLTLLNQLGESNPQLFRELKGQLKSRNLFVGIATSLVCQLLLLVTCAKKYSCLDYAGSNCTPLAWDIQWSFVFRTLDWILPFLVLVCGVYLLISDLGKEEHRGTLNFIRLSPQSSQSILIGKMLGVPALLYLGIVLAVPLHAGSALVAGLPLSWLLGIYTLWGVGCGFLYSAALLLTLLNGSKSGVQALAWSGTFLASLFGLFYISLTDFSFDWYRSSSGLGSWHWFLLPLGHRPELMFVWMLITLSVGTYWIWQAANRLLTNPSATVVSKSQSYWLVASVEVWLLGFVVPQLNSVPSDFQLSIGFGVLFVLNPVGFLVLNAALSPRPQALLDWACYRHKDSSTRQGVLHRSLIKDLIRGAKSPALVAIAINLLISAAIWIPWILLGLGQVESKGEFTTPRVLLGLLLTINVILIYAAIAQVMLFMNRWKRSLWAVGTVSVLIGVPIAIGVVLGISPLEIPFLWLFSPLPILALINASATTVFLCLLAQLGILGLLTLHLTRQLQKAGESASKALFAEPPCWPIGGLKSEAPADPN